MFRNLVGNEHFKETVRKMQQSNRLVHSIILEGEEGIGKHTAAAIISAVALCESENAPCGECRRCRLARELKHTDIHVFSPKGNNFPIKTVRENIRVDAFIKPLEADRKIFILENTELMAPDAQNAMLKILEEPPQSVIFILLVTHAAKLLPTIRSRCLTISLREPPIDEAVEFLSEQTQFHKEEIENALKETDGNIGKAKKLLEDEDSNSTKLLAKMIFDSFFINRLHLLECFHQNLGSKRDLAIKVLSELETIIIKKIKAATVGDDTELPLKTLMGLLPPLKYSEECLLSNCNVPLCLNVLAEEFFDIL